MKKLVILFLLLIVCSPIAFAAIDSIYEYLQRIDNGYEIVLGEKAKGGDSLAAIDVAIGVKKYNRNAPDLEAIIETNSSANESKILIGHPCDNSLIPISCENWPYREGEAIIRIIGNDLIIGGSTIDDTRRAAKIIGNYKNYPQLKETLSVVVTGNGFKNLNVTKEKRNEDMECGDGICEPGESWCHADCAKLSCFEVCEEEGYDEAACRDAKSNPNVASCLAEEYDKGKGFCATGKVCCCKKIPTSSLEDKSTSDEDSETDLLSLWQKILLFFKRPFTSA